MKPFKTHYKFLAVFSVILLILLSRVHCPVNTFTEERIQRMKELYVMQSNGKKSLFPVIVGLAQNVENIFAVPAEDAIGTIDIDNAISFLTFDDEKVTIKIIKKDFSDEVSGEYDFNFLPQYADDEIAYGQTRWMIFQNVVTKKNRTVFIINNLDDYLGRIAVVNPADTLFTFEILKPHGSLGYKNILALAKISGEEYTVRTLIDAGIKRYPTHHAPWTTSAGKLFVYTNTPTNIQVFDEAGNPSSHPIAKIFTANRDKFRRVKEIIFHPELPFALIVDIGTISPEMNRIDEQWASNALTDSQYFALSRPLAQEQSRHAIHLLRWDTHDEKKQLIPLMSNAGNLIPSIDSVRQCSDFQFSPDGKWLVFRDETESRENPVFISIPVSKESPTFLGEPLYLGKVLREGIGMEAKGTAWIKDPVSFVMTDGLVLYKWELGNVGRATVVKQ